LAERIVPLAREVEEKNISDLKYHGRKLMQWHRGNLHFHQQLRRKGEELDDDSIKLEAVLTRRPDSGAHIYPGEANPSVCDPGRRVVVVGIEPNRSVACVAMSVAAILGKKLGMAIPEPDQVRCRDNGGLDLHSIFYWPGCLSNKTCLRGKWHTCTYVA
jgi:hypothetical protein